MRRGKRWTWSVALVVSLSLVVASCAWAEPAVDGERLTVSWVERLWDWIEQAIGADSTPESEGPKDEGGNNGEHGPGIDPSGVAFS